MVKSSCLLDCDGTLRNGFVIRDWTRFLVDKSVINKHTYDLMEDYFSEHRNGRLSYEQMAQMVVDTFAASQNGLHISTLPGLADEFVASDERMFSFAAPLIDFLSRNGIEPVVISGSPKLVVARFAASIGVGRCYGLEVAVDQTGTFLGTASTNLALGMNKRAIIEHLKLKFEEIRLAVGDSISDLPLLQAARCAYLVSDDEVRKLRDQELVKLIEADRVRIMSPEALFELVQSDRILWR